VAKAGDLCDKHLPPSREDPKGTVHVPDGRHQCGPLQHCRVDLRLRREPAQRILVGLDLESVEPAVHERKVNASLAAAKPQFLDEHDGTCVLQDRSKPSLHKGSQIQIADTPFPDGRARLGGNHAVHKIEASVGP